MLDDFWRDIISIAGFVVTVLGFYYAIAQIRKTKSAAVAAEEAAKHVLEESRKNFHKYVALCAHGCIKEIRLHIQVSDWSKAAMRAADLADQMAQMESSMAGELREWVDTFRKLESGTLKRLVNKNWEPFLREIESQIDAYKGPFVPRRQGESNDP